MKKLHLLFLNLKFDFYSRRINIFLKEEKYEKVREYLNKKNKLANKIKELL